MEEYNNHIVETIQSLLKSFGELKEEQKKVLEQTKIALELAKRTDNLDNIRLICRDLGKISSHIIEKDQKLYGELEEVLKDMLVIFSIFDEVKKKLGKR